MFDTYRQQVIPTMEPYGGKFVVRGGKFTVLEGDMPYERVVILEFPSRKSAEDWYNSPAYQKILPFRLKSTKCSFVVADGFE
jgi:uncharacterized protein (DUF1330 family)